VVEGAPFVIHPLLICRHFSIIIIIILLHPIEDLLGLIHLPVDAQLLPVVLDCFHP
jgi:hypothetical protein